MAIKTFLMLLKELILLMLTVLLVLLRMATSWVQLSKASVDIIASEDNETKA